MQLKPLNAALLAAGVTAAGVVVAFEMPTWLASQEKAAVTTQVATTAATATPAAAKIRAPQTLPDYRAIVKQAGPAVVGISVSGMREAAAEGRQLPPELQNDPFFKFFRGIPEMPGQNRQRRGPEGGTPLRGMGSGFIISADGLILTNAHVVRDAKDVTVKLSDRREFTAKVLGSDTTTDIAVLKIDAKDLPTVRLGDPKTLEVGDPVLAIGAPYGLEQTATQGIVSAKGRSLPGDAVVPFIQTDAAVNPGNSGGPLFDGNGEVVGINAQIYSRSGGYQGLSFAIPINVALKVKDQIVATGKASHARLGVTIQDLNQALADSFGLKRPDGALIANVAPNSAAAAAGLKSGDVVTAVDGQPVRRSGELSSLIGLAAPGEQVKLEVWRDREVREITAKLGSADESVRVAAAADGAVSGGQLGLALRPLTPEELRAAKVEQGMVVENVGGPAAAAGIETGDVLLAINGKPVQSVDQVKKVLDTKPKSVALLLQRDGERIFVPVKLG